MPKRQGNNPKRRVVSAAALSQEMRDELLRRTRYRGSEHHKVNPADYKFDGPVQPRRSKTLCDGKSRRLILLKEARQLFKQGIARGLVSQPGSDGLPKYVWAVDAQGEAYEAKRSREGHIYHGYPLDEKRDKLMR